MLRIDKSATEAAKFKDRRSYVRPNGKRYLRGKDREDLRRAVYERSKGYCEMHLRGQPSYAFCNRCIDWTTFELHHEPPLSNGGDDSLAGTLASCRRCHQQRHNRVIKWTVPQPEEPDWMTGHPGGISEA